ncbi:hypothetical protein MBAV_004468 [Candidatus Magnetobacterium bavaricum]|uniref:Uncharacterized protein n=1 Tax=Candidatus Magnetobacterium bavaricum TaxID=29290 RepID=A0A0F3GNF8_9BACT|nr:hypothetical protein MBAV_004468 [Candidatus Magnetobacterium bavaricum]
MRLEKWSPAFAGMTANGVFVPSMPAPGLNRGHCRANRNPETAKPYIIYVLFNCPRRAFSLSTIIDVATVGLLLPLMPCKRSRIPSIPLKRIVTSSSSGRRRHCLKNCSTFSMLCESDSMSLRLSKLAPAFME